MLNNNSDATISNSLINGSEKAVWSHPLFIERSWNSLYFVFCSTEKSDCVVRDFFSTNLMTYLALFIEKKILLILFLSSKSQEKQDLQRWKSFREHTWQQRQSGRYPWSTLFGRVSRDRSFQWMTISNHSNCQLKIIQPFPSISSHYHESRPLKSPPKGSSVQLFCQTFALLDQTPC